MLHFIYVFLFRNIGTVLVLGCSFAIKLHGVVAVSNDGCLDPIWIFGFVKGTLAKGLEIGVTSIATTTGVMSGSTATALVNIGNNSGVSMDAMTIRSCATLATLPSSFKPKPKCNFASM